MRPGLYAITPDWSDTSHLLAAVGQVLTGGAAMLQYRNKQATPALRTLQAQALLTLCRAHRVPLIINDHLALALDIDADGVHLGADDGAVHEARRALGPHRLLGVSCYANLEAARAAQAAGADYVAFGAAFPSRTKPDAMHAALAVYRQARIELECGIVAIGGITLDNAASLIAAGVDHIAVIGALFDSGEPAQQARAFSALFG